MPGNNIPIRTVCAMYGINPNTLRTWERRYAIIRPHRGSGGQRSYGPTDVATIANMIGLISGGLSPAEAARKLSRPDGRRAKTPAVRTAGTFQAKLQKAIGKLDAAAAHEVCGAAMRELGYVGCVEKVLFPVLAAVGHGWQGTPNGIAIEHLLTLTARAFLLEQFHHLVPRVIRPRITLACVPGEAHDVSLIHLANLMLSRAIARPHLMIAGLPIHEIVESSTVLKSAIIVLSATIEPTAAEVREWIAELGAAGWAKSTVLVGDGFVRSRVYSETEVRAAVGDYQQAVSLLESLLPSSNGRSRP
jgi:MerR family transcriptional regulator, light-induced transcriptional regulator